MDFISEPRCVEKQVFPCLGKAYDWILVHVLALVSSTQCRGERLKCTAFQQVSIFEWLLGCYSW